MRKFYWVGLVLALIAVAGAAVFWGQRSQEFGNSTALVTEDRQYTLEVVTTSEDKSRGLSGRELLAQDRGMLFVYNREGVRCFWMKDMKFSLDIIWLNKRREVMYVEQNVSPDTYPKSFCPAQDTQYVIELNANEANRANIKQGDKLAF